MFRRCKGNDTRGVLSLPESDVEEVIAGLSQDERLDLLERPIRGATGSEDEALSTEERIERLEKTAWDRGCGCRRGSGIQVPGAGEAVAAAR